MKLKQREVVFEENKNTSIFSDISGEGWKKTKYIFFMSTILILASSLIGVIEDRNFNNSNVLYILSNIFSLITDGLILFITAFSLTKLILFVCLSLKYTLQKEKNSILYNEDYLVSVIIPAYNEEKVICKTINSILKNNYRNFEIIVVNDGSTDRTLETIEERFAESKYVTIIDKLNSGKSDSINLGVKEAKGEIMVLIDADTIIDKNAISNLVRHFYDKNVAAVCGNILVGNRKNFITRLQNIEYITSLNFDKKALAEINSVDVVAGALGAWRIEYIKDLNGFKMDTLVEDRDLTLNLLAQRYTVKYDDEAFAYTEAPENIDSLVRQRHRWCFGTLQCIWKNRNKIFRKSLGILGLVTLPYMIISYLLPLVSFTLPLLCMIEYIISGDFKLLFITYTVSLISDYIIVIYSFILSGKRINKKDVVLVIFFRTINKYFLVYILLKSLKSILSGSFVGWDKLNRTGNVSYQ